VVVLIDATVASQYKGLL